MPPAERHGGPIDPFTENDLRDFVGEDANLTPGEDHFEFYGVFLIPVSESRFVTQLDGHSEVIQTFDTDDYGDVLELVDDLMDTVIRWHDFQYREDRDGLVEWAGRIMTSNEDRANANPEHYIHVPHPEE